MMKESLVIALGAFVLVTPYLGIPNNWKTMLLVGVGAALIALGVFVRRSAQICQVRHPNGEKRTDAYVEHEKLHM